MVKNALGNNIFITFATKSFNMTLQKCDSWVSYILDRGCERVGNVLF